MWTVESIKEVREQIKHCPQTLGNVRDYALLSIAMDALGEVTGRTMREDITNRIFERFCVGK